MIRLAVRCSPQFAEQVLAELVAIAPSGVEESAGEGWVEYAVYGPPGELPELPALEAAAGDALIEVRTSEVGDDWAERWRDFHKPVLAGGGRVRVRPPWIAATGAPGDPEIDLVIEPGRAFGTGAHATTRMCLDLLCELAAAGLEGSVTDLGTGSGVLAIAASRLGLGPVSACDNDPAAVEIARANAEDNSAAVDLSVLDLREARPPDAELWLANLTVPVLKPLAPWLADNGWGPRRLILSGVPATETDPVAAAFRAVGCSLTTIRHEGEWAALLLRR